jgi:hypothetical protein
MCEIMKEEFEIQARRQVGAIEQLQDDNNRLKLKLVQVLSGSTTMEDVQWLDVFHTTVLDIDAMLAILRYDIARLACYAHEMAAEDLAAETLVTARHGCLRDEIKVVKDNIEALAQVLESHILKEISPPKPAAINSTSASASFRRGS